MQLSYDLHIHSCLSPCADDDMTPNNVINMCKIKGLDVISITDHNSTINLDSFINTAKKMDIIFIPGVEIETQEEIHVLLYFKDISIINEFQDLLDSKLKKIPNHKEIYGNQFIVDEQDNILYEYNDLLLQPLDVSIDELFNISNFFDMLFIPAHINRESYGLIGRLGSIPEYILLNNIFEISHNQEIDVKNFIKKDSLIFKSSDAHRLWEINERVNFIDSSILYTIFF
ncbi:PHP domain-containing protein [Caldicellulosiruptoraceae bacterium PP1]